MFDVDLGKGMHITESELNVGGSSLETLDTGKNNSLHCDCLYRLVQCQFSISIDNLVNGLKESNCMYAYLIKIKMKIKHFTDLHYILMKLFC